MSFKSILLAMALSTFAINTAEAAPLLVTAEVAAHLDKTIYDLVSQCVNNKITFEEMMINLRRLSEIYGKEAVLASLSSTRVVFYLQWQNALAWARGKGVEAIANASKFFQATALIEAAKAGGMYFPSTSIIIIPEDWMRWSNSAPDDARWESDQAQIDLRMDDYVVADSYVYEDDSPYSGEASGGGSYSEDPNYNNPDEWGSGSGSSTGTSGTPETETPTEEEEEDDYEDTERCCGRELDLLPPLDECFPWPHGPRRFPVIEEVLAGVELLPIYEEPGYTLMGVGLYQVWSSVTNEYTPMYSMHLKTPENNNFELMLTPNEDMSQFCYTYR